MFASSTASKLKCRRSLAAQSLEIKQAQCKIRSDIINRGISASRYVHSERRRLIRCPRAKQECRSFWFDIDCQRGKFTNHRIRKINNHWSSTLLTFHLPLTKWIKNGLNDAVLKENAKFLYVFNRWAVQLSIETFAGPGLQAKWMNRFLREYLCAFSTCRIWTNYPPQFRPIRAHEITPGTPGISKVLLQRSRFVFTSCMFLGAYSAASSC